MLVTEQAAHRPCVHPLPQQMEPRKDRLDLLSQPQKHLHLTPWEPPGWLQVGERMSGLNVPLEVWMDKRK